jgi:hypothetical protein
MGRRNRKIPICPFDFFQCIGKKIGRMQKSDPFFACSCEQSLKVRVSKFRNRVLFQEPGSFSESRFRIRQDMFDLWTRTRRRRPGGRKAVPASRVRKHLATDRWDQAGPGDRSRVAGSNRKSFLPGISRRGKSQPDLRPELHCHGHSGRHPSKSGRSVQRFGRGGLYLQP